MLEGNLSTSRHYRGNPADF